MTTNSSNVPADVILFCKSDFWSNHASSLARIIFGERVYVIKGGVDSEEPLPDGLQFIKPKFVISFLSPWILPHWLLRHCSLAINFHPGSRRYPGIGCYNFALYENAPTYGCVCHHMTERVDEGDIILEREFRVLEDETVESLKFRTMIEMLQLYHSILCVISDGFSLPEAKILWERKPFTRKQLNELCVIAPEMTPEEVNRRIRATTYPGYPGAQIEVHGVCFRAAVPDRDPLA